MADACIRALTVRQPWAWAITHGGKNVENRSRRTHYRGPLLIHAGATWSTRGQRDPRIQALPFSMNDAGHARSSIVAIADLVDCHPGDGCCEPWGETQYVHADGHTVTEVWHLVLEQVLPIRPIPCSGRLGLWRPDDDLLAHVADRIALGSVS